MEIDRWTNPDAWLTTPTVPTSMEYRRLQNGLVVGVAVSLILYGIIAELWQLLSHR